MASFPILRTGAVSQYPSGREVRYSTQIIQYIDGNEQRFANLAGADRRWIVNLKNITSAEAAAMRRFFMQQRGRNASFSFTDPWTGTIYPECRFDTDNMSVTYEDENACASELVIRTHRG